MHQPDDAPLARPTPNPMPLPPTADMPVARGVTTRATPALAEPTAYAEVPPPSMSALSVARAVATLMLPAGASAVRAQWVRRIGWIALLTLLVLLPVAQWGSSTDDLYAAAASARTAWRYDHALALYARIARLDPSDPRPHCLQGQVLALQLRFTQAQAAYATCERLGDTTSDTWLAQGDAASSAGQTGAAEQDWKQSVAAGSLAAHRRLGLLYEQQGRLTEAASQWQALGPTDAQAQEHLGLLALQAGDYATAREAIVAARTLPGFYGQEAVEQGFAVLAAQPPRDAAGFAAIGVAFVQAGMPALARQPLAQAVTLNPNYGPAHAYLAWVQFAAGQLALAQTEAAAAVRLAPGESFGWFVAAEVAMASGQWSSAADDAQNGLTHDNQNPVIWAALGSAYLGQHDYVHAELSLADAAQLGSEPQFTIDLLNFYVAHRTGVALGRAARAASTALARYPANAQVALLAGECYELSRSVDLADAAYVRANALDPSLPDPYFYLGRIALDGDDLDLATLDLSTYLALRPDGDLAAQARALLGPLVALDL